MSAVPKRVVDELRAAVDSAVAYEVANPGVMPDFVVEVVAASSALLRAIDPEAPVPTRKPPVHDEADVRSWSVASGYTGDACTRCGSFTLRRKGTCLSCDSCAHSSGCS